MKKGFTLVEILIAITLSFIFIGSAFFFLGQIYKSGEKNSKFSEKIVFERSLLDDVSKNARFGTAFTVSTNYLEIKTPKNSVSYLFKDGEITKTQGKSSYIMNPQEKISSLAFKREKKNFITITLGSLETGVFLYNEK